LRADPEAGDLRFPVTLLEDAEPITFFIAISFSIDLMR